MKNKLKNFWNKNKEKIAYSLKYIFLGLGYHSITINKIDEACIYLLMILLLECTQINTKIHMLEKLSKKEND